MTQSPIDRRTITAGRKERANLPFFTRLLSGLLGALFDLDLVLAGDGGREQAMPWPWRGRDEALKRARSPLAAGWRQVVVVVVVRNAAVWAGQAKAARSRWKPSPIWAAHRQVRSMRSRVVRAERVSWAAACSTR